MLRQPEQGNADLTDFLSDIAGRFGVNVIDDIEQRLFIQACSLNKFNRFLSKTSDALAGIVGCGSAEGGIGPLQNFCLTLLAIG